MTPQPRPELSALYAYEPAPSLAQMARDSGLERIANLATNESQFGPAAGIDRGRLAGRGRPAPLSRSRERADRADRRAQRGLRRPGAGRERRRCADRPALHRISGARGRGRDGSALVCHLRARHAEDGGRTGERAAQRQRLRRGRAGRRRHSRHAHVVRLQPEQPHRWHRHRRRAAVAVRHRARERADRAGRGVRRVRHRGRTFPGLLGSTCPRARMWHCCARFPRSTASPG